MIPPPGLSRLSVNISITAFAISLPPTASTPTFFTYNLHKVLGNSVSSPPLFAHYFETKWTGAGVYQPRAYAPTHEFLAMLCAILIITTTAASFWKSSSFAEHVLWESVVLVLILKPRSIKATCIVSSMGQGTILVLRATKNLSLANEHA